MTIKLPTGLHLAWDLAVDTFIDWVEDNAMSRAAAVAFYAVLSIAPLMLIVLSITGAVFGDAVARTELLAQLDRWVGVEASKGVLTLLDASHGQSAKVFRSPIGFGVSLVGASGVFSELRQALNTIWKVKVVPGQVVRGFVRRTLFAFIMVVAAGGLLLSSVVVSAVLSKAGSWLTHWWTGAAWTWQFINFALFFGLAIGVFALVFRVVPDAPVRWRHAFPGAMLTALLFMLGKAAIGFYLAHASIASAYGAAGSFVVLIVWVYYSSQIFFIGAEFTQVYAKRFGPTAEPLLEPVAVATSPSEDAQSKQTKTEEA